MNEPTLKEVMAKLERVEQLLVGRQSPALPAVAVETRPLTARELMERWGIDADSHTWSLACLARRCRERGLVRMEGSDGWGAMYALEDVLRAEAVAKGTVKRRRKPVGKKRGVLKLNAEY